MFEIYLYIIGMLLFKIYKYIFIYIICIYIYCIYIYISHIRAQIVELRFIC